MTKTNTRIPTRISPDMLDTFGRSFRFNHGKGAAEWLKNCLDNYLRLYHAGEESLAGNWPVFINLTDAQSQSKGPNLAVIDFGGTSHQNVDDFFLHWGDTSAATLGGATAAAVTGGHGNGGKFYMREMWRGGSRFITWKNGKVTSLVVDRAGDGTTGEWELQDESMNWRQALDSAMPISESLGGAAWLIDYLESEEPQLIAELENNERGFTVVVGRLAKQIHSSNDVVRGGRWKHQQFVDDLRHAPQARRPIRELAITVFVNGEKSLDRLSPEEVEEDPDWPTEIISLPVELIRDDELRAGAAALGSFQLKKAANQLEGRKKHLNSIFVVDGNDNPIAHYPVKSLPLPGHSPISGFLHGELILSFPMVESLVANDRERLVESATTQSILEEVADYLWRRVAEFEKEQRQTEQKAELTLAEVLNDALNAHARRFLQELETEIMVDFVTSPEGGGPGGGGVGVGGVGRGGGDRGKRTSGRGGDSGDGGAKAEPGTTKRERRPRFPSVLLSGHHQDPSRDDGGSKDLTPRHPPLHQDDVDKTHNVWWINTSHPFSEEALKRGGARGHSFRSFHLFMFVQVVQLESLRILQRREAELGIDVVENELSDRTNNFLAELPVDLVSDLLD